MDGRFVIFALKDERKSKPKCGRDGRFVIFTFPDEGAN